MNIKMGAKSPFVFPSVVHCSFIHFCVSSGFRQLDGKMPDGLQMQFYIFFDELWQTADAGLVLFAGASFFVIMLHASTYVPQEAAEGFDLEMDGIQTV